MATWDLTLNMVLSWLLILLLTFIVGGILVPQLRNDKEEEDAENANDSLQHVHEHFVEPLHDRVDEDEPV